jgi:glycosyltransferase involved in cell wall biosynthesis
MSRILLIAERFPPDIGGVASSAGRIAKNLCQLGHEVDVVVWSRYLQPGQVVNSSSDTEEPQTEINLFPHLQIYRVGLYRHWDMSMTQTLNVLDWLHSQHSYEAVWGHYLFPAGFFAVWFAQLKGLPSLVSARGNDVDRGVFPPGDFARLQWTLEQTDVIAAVSQDLAKKIQLVSRRNDIIVLKNAVDTELFAPVLAPPEKMALRQSLGIAEKEIVLGFAGELREKKGQAFLLPALTRVREQCEACLLIIGEVRTTQEAELQVYSLQHPEDYQRTLITGHLSEPAKVAQYLQLCDVFLLPSLWEGLPNALLEAMSCGLGCIASDAGGIPEVIVPGVNGFLVSRSQLHRLGEAILEYLELEENKRETLSQAARDLMLAEYSLAAEKKRLQTAIARLIPKDS